MGMSDGILDSFANCPDLTAVPPDHERGLHFLLSIHTRAGDTLGSHVSIIMRGKVSENNLP